MKIQEIREKSIAELQLRVGELHQSAFHLRLQQKSGQLEKPSELRVIRREIARIQTILSQRRIAASRPVKPAPKAAQPVA